MGIRLRLAGTLAAATALAALGVGAASAPAGADPGIRIGLTATGAGVVPLKVQAAVQVLCAAADRGQLGALTDENQPVDERTAEYRQVIADVGVRLVHTQAEMDAALVDSSISYILVMPREGINIQQSPANPDAGIHIHDPLPRIKLHRAVIVRGNLHVSSSGAAHVYGYDSAHITASGSGYVTAYKGSPQVTAYGAVEVNIGSVSSRIRAFEDVRVDASACKGTVDAHDRAQVVLTSDTEGTVTGHGPSVRIWTREGQKHLVHADPATVYVIAKNKLYIGWDALNKAWNKRHQS